jgi:hypothetical protein
MAQLAKTQLIPSVRVRTALEPNELYAERRSVAGPRSRSPGRITLFLDREILGNKSGGRAVCMVQRQQGQSLSIRVRIRPERLNAMRTISKQGETNETIGSSDS